MIARLLNTLSLYDTGLIIRCGLIVAGLFTLLYGLSYSITSRTYYGIVKQMKTDVAAERRIA